MKSVVPIKLFSASSVSNQGPGHRQAQDPARRIAVNRPAQRDPTRARAATATDSQPGWGTGKPACRQRNERREDAVTESGHQIKPIFAKQGEHNQRDCRLG